MMPADLAEFHAELRAVARDLLAAPGPDREAGWQRLAEAGWLGLEVPAALDGADATFAEVAVIAEELGRAAACSAYLGTAVLGAGTLRLLEPGPGRDELLRGAASGNVILAAALTDGAGGWPVPGGWPEPGGAGAGGARSAGPPFRLAQTPGGLRLHGRAAFVPDAAEACRLLLLAAGPDGEPVIAAAAPGTSGLTVTDQPVLDETRSLGLVTADGAAVPAASVWQFRGDPPAAVGRLLDRAAVAVACDSLGISEAMLAATVGHAQVREQFGRPIGSFQAVKHACADMLVQISVARELVAAAVAALADDGPGGALLARGAAAPAPACTVAASMAKAQVSATAVGIAGKAMQLHGGMGYTWESGIHVYLKRATLNRSLFGSPAAHRRRLAMRYR